MRTRQYTFFLGSLGPYDFSMDVTLSAELIEAFPSIGGNNAALTDIAAYERDQLARGTIIYQLQSDAAQFVLLALHCDGDRTLIFSPATSFAASMLAAKI